MESLPLAIRIHINSFLVPKVLRDVVPFPHYLELKGLTFDFFHQPKWFLVCCNGLCERPSHWEHEIVNRRFSRYSDEIIESRYYARKLGISDQSEACIYCGYADEDSDLEMYYEDQWERDWAEYQAYGDWDNADPEDMV